jgi:hypothetical protein
MENRDLWEYQLDLSPEEVDRVLMHAWELGPAYFQYFFFDENCAYHLLGLLQVAKPDLDLTSNFRWWAIPTDTVREITRQPGLVKKVVYRPSSATIVQHQLSLLNGSERRLAQDLSMGRIAASDPALSAIPVKRAAAVLEASENYLGYRRSTGNDDVADPAGLARELLTARSRLDVPSQTPGVPVPAVRPDQGHGSARLTFGVGRWEDQNYQEITARPAYHDLMDDDAGYTRGAQNEFFDLSLRHYDSSATEVERFIPVNIFSLTPRDDFFHPLSWNISTGWQRMRAVNGGYPLVFSLDGGAGGAWSNPGDTALWYALFDSSSRAGSDLENGYALGAGARAGALLDISPRWRVHGYVRGMRYFLGQRDSPLMLGLEQRVALGRNLALRIDASRNRELQRTYNNGSVSMLFYF